MSNIYNMPDFLHFTLPPERIAQHPPQQRDQAKLLVYHRANHAIQHQVFSDVLSHLNPGDVLVLNNTQVLPARFWGVKHGASARIELLFMEPAPAEYAKKTGLLPYYALIRPSKRLRPKAGTEHPQVILADGTLATLLQPPCSETQQRGVVGLPFQNHQQVINWMYATGEMPIPPYLERPAQEADKQDYQTVYASVAGSVAAPTAGLHFTQALLEKIQEKGILLAFVTLHVSSGTFRPIKVADYRDHVMDAEYCVLPEETATVIKQAKARGNRVIAVGTTAAKTLESFGPSLEPGQQWSQLYITPETAFRVVDALITNFHLPQSTLLLLVAAFLGSGDVLKHCYQQAIEHDYRFFSYGDAMLIV